MLRVGVYFYPRTAPPDSIPAPPNRIIVRTGQKIASIIVEAAERLPTALVSPSSLANASCNANDIVTPDGSIADNIITDDAPPAAAAAAVAGVGGVRTRRGTGFDDVQGRQRQIRHERSEPPAPEEESPPPLSPRQEEHAHGIGCGGEVRQTSGLRRLELPRSVVRTRVRVPRPHPETQTCVKLSARLHVVAPQCHEHHRIRRSHAHHRAYREARGAAFPPYSTIWLMR